MGKAKLLLAFFLSLVSIVHTLQAEANFNFDNTSNWNSFDKNCCSYNDYSLLGYVSHIEGGGISYSSGYTTLGLLYTPDIYLEQWQPFLDLREHCFNNGKQAFNIGLGTRYFSSCLDTVFGLNVYYDYRYAHKSLHQIGVGLEMLGSCFDLRANGYFPVGNRSSNGHKHRYVFSNEEGPDFVATCQVKQRALTGFDAEIGTSLNNWWCGCTWFDLYLAAGPYYYHIEEGCRDSFWGGRARLEADFCKYWTVEVSTTFDSYYHTIVQGLVMFSIPFGCPSVNCCPDVRMKELVYRNEIIVNDKRHCQWHSNF